MNILIFFISCVFIFLGIDLSFDLFDPTNTKSIPYDKLEFVFLSCFGERFINSSRGTKLLLQMREIAVRGKEEGSLVVKKDDFTTFMKDKDTIMGPLFHVQKAVQSKVLNTTFWSNASIYREQHPLLTNITLHDFPNIMKISQLPPEKRMQALVSGVDSSSSSSSDPTEGGKWERPDLTKQSIDVEYMKNRIEWAAKDAEYRFETIFEKLELISQKSNIPTSQPEKGNEDYDEIRQDYLRREKRSLEKDRLISETDYALEASKQSTKRIERFHKVTHDYQDVDDSRALQILKYT